MADTAAALVIQLQADFKDFKKQMQQATGIFDTEGRKIARKQADLKKQLSNWTLDFTGLKGLRSALLGLTAVGIVGGIGDLIKKSLDAASAIGDVAQQSGVSVEFLQKLRFAASQSGASFDILDQGLTTLNKNIGDFVNTGSGKAAQAFKQLGIDKLIKSGDVRDTEQAFDAVVKKINTFGSEAQKSALLAGVFGKEAGPKLLQLVEQGTDGLARLEAQAVSLGVVLSTQTVQGAKEANDKLDALFTVIKAEGINAVAGQAKEIAHLADEIAKGLPSLIAWVEHWADFFGLINASASSKIKYYTDDIASLKKTLAEGPDTRGPLSHLWSPDWAIKQQIKEDEAAIAEARKHLVDLPAPTKSDTSLPKLNVAQSPEEIAAAKAAAALAQRQKQALAQTVLDAKTAAAALLAAQDATNVQLLKGSAGYYDAIQKQIQDDYQSKVDVVTAERDKQLEQLNQQGKDWAGYATAVANINKAMNDKIAAADEERKQKQDENSPSGQLLRDAMENGRQLIQQYHDQDGALGLATAALAKYNYVQDQYNKYIDAGIPLTEDIRAKISAEGDAVAEAAQRHKEASDAMSENVQIADNLRDGLVDIGVTAATQSGNFKQAVAQMILSLIQLITKLELTKIAQDALGESGTPLSFLGSLFGGGGSSIEPVTVTPSVFGTFAKGGVFVPGRGAQPLKRFAGGGISTSAAIFGEAGAEAAVPLPDGRRIPVELRIPNIPNAGVGAGPAITVIHDGSTDIAIQRMRNNNIRVIARQEIDAATAGIVGQSVVASAAAAPSVTAQVNKNPRRRTIA